MTRLLEWLRRGTVNPVVVRTRYTVVCCYTWPIIWNLFLPPFAARMLPTRQTGRHIGQRLSRSLSDRQNDDDEG